MDTTISQTVSRDPSGDPMAKRVGIFAYGVISYAIFFATFCYAFFFVGNLTLGGLIPKTIDSGREIGLAAAIGINLALLGVFAIQHSVMARPTFKRWWTRVIPQEAERSTYTLFSSVCMIAMFILWQPMGGVIWNTTDPAVKAVMWSLCGFGWALVLVSTFLINHFDLFGLRQVWLYLLGKPYTELKFGTPGPYKLVRHPLYVGWLFAFWFTPTMTAAHLFFAVVTTAYILVAIQLEERNLSDLHPEYSEYKKQAGMLTPKLGKKPTPQSAVVDPAPRPATGGAA